MQLATVLYCMLFHTECLDCATEVDVIVPVSMVIVVLALAAVIAGFGIYIRRKHKQVFHTVMIIFICCKIITAEIK